MKRLLIADHSHLMRLSLKKMVTKHGYTVVGEATTGKEAFEKYKELSPDIIILCVSMKEMTGMEALEKIIEYDSEAYAIMAATVPNYFIEQAIALGAKGFMLRPYSEKHVVATLSRANSFVGTPASFL